MSAPAPGKFGPNTRSLVLLMGSLLSFGPMAVDMYVPSLPLVVAGLGTTTAAAQLTLSAFLAGFAVGQLVWGPLSDRVGRRPAVIGGVAVFAGASIVCLVAPSIEVLVAARFAQALGAAAGQVLTRAVIRDLHGPVDNVRMLAHATMVMGVSSMLSPAVGGVLAAGLGWRVLFLVHAAFSLAVLAVVLRGLGESSPRRDPAATRPLPLLRNFARFLSNRVFAGYTASLCCMFGALFAFISGGPFVFNTAYGMAPQDFGFVFAPIAGAFVAGTLMAGYAARRVAVPRLFAGASLTVAAGGALLLGTVLTGTDGVVTVVVPLTLITLAMGFVLPLGVGGAIAPFPEAAGSASSLVGFLQSTFSASVGVFVGLVLDGTARPMILVIAVLAAGVPLTYFTLVRPWNGARKTH